MRTCTILAALVFALLASVSAAAQVQGSKVSRIGLLSHSDEWVSFHAQLKELGYVEGKNIEFEIRPLPAITSQQQAADRYVADAEDLVRRQIDIIVASSAIAGGLAARRATSAIPIVIVRMADPLGMGLASSLARPDGNVTGSNTQSAELTAKRLELLKEIAPQVLRIVVLGVDRNPAFTLSVQQTEAAARALGVTLYPVGVRQGRFEDAVPAILEARAEALLVLQGLGEDHDRIAAFALQNRLPAAYTERSFAEAEGLVSYGPSRAELFRRAAIYVDKIIKGARPAELPIEQPTKLEFVINLKIARALGLAIPDAILARADEVIE